MRSCDRELGRNVTYEVELDTTKVVNSVVDTMFSELDLPQNKELLNWLINYSIESVEKGNSWSVKNEIVSLSNELFKETFKLKKVKSFDNIGELKSKLIQIKSSFTSSLLELLQQGRELIKSSGLEYDNFKGGSRSPFKYFATEKLYTSKVIEPPKDGFIALYDNVGKWYTGKNYVSQIEGVYSAGLNECIGNIINLFDSKYKLYITSFIILNNINALGILDEVYSRILKYCKENNIMLISESTELLNRIIGGDDIPFIYEKIGGRIDNFMLDEFQDTSFLQWNNFVPLLSNSLAQGFDNLIVGDVKQSIYRWRGSDWNILNSRVYECFDRNLINDFNLNFNWRSSKNIVEFTNSFFSFCANAVQDRYDEDLGIESSFIKGIYEDFKQQVPNVKKANDGYIEINFVNDSKADESVVLGELPKRVKALLDSGASKKDIAILVRTRNQGRMVASALIAENIDVISNDSLFIGASVAVQKILLTLRAINNAYKEDNGHINIFNCLFICDPYISSDLHGKSIYACCEEIIRESLTVKDNA